MKAETEIRIFNNDFGPDGPVHRYKVNLMVARATRTLGILEEDRIAILEQAQELAMTGTEKYPNNKNMLSAYVELGIIYYKKTKRFEFYDDAMEKMKAAEERNGDPEISKTMREEWLVTCRSPWGSLSWIDIERERLVRVYVVGS